MIFFVKFIFFFNLRHFLVFVDLRFLKFKKGKTETLWIRLPPCVLSIVFNYFKTISWIILLDGFYSKQNEHIVCLWKNKNLVIADIQSFYMLNVSMFKLTWEGTLNLIAYSTRINHNIKIFCKIKHLCSIFKISGILQKSVLKSAV